MKKHTFLIGAIIIANLFWFFDASVHYFIYNEVEFEFIPDDFNELWMRTVIIALIITLGWYADYHSEKMLTQHRQLEAANIYKSMLHATHHILNNLLNQTQIIKIEALNSKDFDQHKIELYDNAISEASALIKRLSEVEKITDEEICASVDPNKIYQETQQNRL